jgi:hypothetical protein
MHWFHEHTDVVEIYCTCLAKVFMNLQVLELQIN